jgi:hypothetical protein
MKPILNKVPDRPIFVCIRRSNHECQAMCRVAADTPHIHDSNMEYTFFCDQMQRHVKCMELK